ncbi:MAG: hypothetical protein ACLQOO_06735, partial [Terriglobia bacterium]
DQNVVLVVDGGKTQVALGEMVEGQPVRTQYVAGGTAAFTAGIGEQEWPEWREAEVAAALRKKYLETSVALRGKNQVGGITKDDLVASFMEALGRDGVRDSGLGEETGFGIRGSQKKTDPNPLLRESPTLKAKPRVPPLLRIPKPEPRIPFPPPRIPIRPTPRASRRWPKQLTSG